MQSEKDQLLADLAEKQAQLSHVTKQASGYKAGRYTTSGHVQTSKVHMRTLQQQIKDLKAKLSGIDNKLPD